VTSKLRLVARSEQPNSYSQHWFEFFHTDIADTRTTWETDFICNCAPVFHFRKILDVCCGTGRHARTLAKRGYVVTGIDRDADAIAKARELGAGPRYICGDIRDYQAAPRSFDAAFVMGQSFGYFDEVTNRDVLGRLAESVRDRGRIILDLWNPEFFAVHQGQHNLETPRGVVRENKHLKHDRLFVQLEYPGGDRENFEWQLFTPIQMERFAESVGLMLFRSCSGFDATKVPSSDDPRLQFLLEAT
jgi:SAM-dependent methyltransferase